MSVPLLVCLSAFWLGVLTSISPCPLTGNIAATAYLCRRFTELRWMAFSGGLYALGRTGTYMVLAAILVFSLSSAWQVSSVLQKYMNMALGPFLIFVGLVLLNVLRWGSSWPGWDGQKLQRRLDALGSAGAVLLGIVLALSFCPISAALFFGSLIPLALQHESVILIPVLYGLGTALPVLTVGVAVAAGARWVSQLFNRITQFEVWIRRLTGGTILTIGLYLTWSYWTG